MIEEKGQVITQYLIDSTNEGRIKASLSNWPGIAYKIPRTELSNAKSIAQLSQSGVYFLFGESDETQEKYVYIGQASVRKNGEGVLNRLQEHRRDDSKDYWTEAVILTTADNSLGHTEISYLERNFKQLAEDSQRYTVKNSAEPPFGNVTEEQEAMLSRFINNALLVIGNLGYKAFEPLVKSEDEVTEVSDNHYLYLERAIRKMGETIKAVAKQTNEGIVVLKGSQISSANGTAIPPSIKEKRETEGLIIDGILQKDMLFKSPSYAGAFVIGGNCNGKAAWRDSAGRTLNQIDDAAAAEATKESEVDGDSE